jgi:uncharacterized protein
MHHSSNHTFVGICSRAITQIGVLGTGADRFSGPGPRDRFASTVAAAATSVSGSPGRDDRSLGRAVGKAAHDGSMTTHATGDRSVDPPALRPPANRVSPRAVWYWFGTATTGWCVLLAAQLLALLSDWPFPPWKVQLLLLSAAVAVIHVSIMPWWRFRVHRWELTDTAVYTRTGWWTQEWRIAPLSRVQTVDSSRGPVARMFRLCELTVTTASAAGPLKIQALDEQTAAHLAAGITAAAQAFRGDGT